MSGGLSIFRETPKPDLLLLRLKGVFEGYSVQQAESELVGYMNHDVASEILLDFTEIRYIDSSGVGVLTQMAKAAEGRHLKMGVYNIDERVRRVLTMTGTLKMITIYDKLPF